MIDKAARQKLDQAVQLHQSGAFDKAADLYRQVLAKHPDHADALHLLGIVTHQKGDHAAAAQLIRKALAVQPGTAEYLANLGLVLAAAHDFEEAIAAYRQAAALQPNRHNIFAGLGNALRAAGHRQEAITAYRRSAALQPDQAAAQFNLANFLREMDLLDDAVVCYRKFLALRPDDVDAMTNLGETFRLKGQLDEAISCFTRAIALRPDMPAAHNNLGVALLDKGQFPEAIAALCRSVSLQPTAAETHLNLGNAYKANGQLDQAVAAFKEALRLRPNFPAAANNLGVILSRTARASEAIEICRRALAMTPDYPPLCNTLGNSLLDCGQVQSAIDCYTRAVELEPRSVSAASNCVYALFFHPDSDAKALLQEAQKWNALFAAPLASSIKPHGNDRSPDRRLRIGYVSPDFGAHVVGWNLLPLVRQHDHDQFEIVFYSNQARTDATAVQLRSCADLWRDIARLDDEQAEDLIRNDRIDILVDLTLHMACNRLLLFARKPAPVQVTYLGYCGTTGLNTIDYRLSDPYLDPPGEEEFYSEETLRLPRTYWCYEPGGPTPEVAPLPALTAGHITFGCLNNFAKVSPASLDLWAQILASVPHSHLIVHANPGAYLESVRQRFTRLGVAAERLEFVAKRPWPEYLQTYQRIDIGLDPFPYAGGITTCDALWMGLPMITLSGRTAVGRGGRSILSNIGLPDLVAYTPEQYLHLATDLAGDIPRLTELRAGLRKRMLHSPLMDAPHFARAVEAVYRDIWRRWAKTVAMMS